MTGVPPQGGGAYDAINHALDTEEYDSPASADVVQVAVDDVGEGVEADFRTSQVFQRVVLDSVDFAGATQRPQNPVLLIDPNTGNMFAAWQAGAGPQDDNLGNESIGGSTFNVTSDRQDARQITVPAGGGFFTSLSAYGLVNTTRNARFVVYEDNGGAPGNLIGYTEEVTIGTSAAWWSADIVFDANGVEIEGVQLAAGTYWISIFSDGQGFTFTWYYDASGTSYDDNSDTYALPEDPWSGGLSGTRDLSVYITGTLAPTGIVAAWSLDGGFTWTAPAQVMALMDPYVPSAVIDPVSGDIHVCVAKLGKPSLDISWSLYYQVLPWTGSVWDVTLTTLILDTGSTARAFSNCSLAVDDNGFLCVAYMEFESDDDVWIDTQVSNGPWDLSISTLDEEFQITDDIEARIKLLWADDVSTKRWMMLIEQNGVYRLYRAEDVLSSSAHALGFGQSQTYFESSTAEFDMVHQAFGLSGACGIVQKNGDKVEYRTWSPTGDGLSGPTTIEGDVSNPCRYPTIVADAGEFIVLYSREFDTDDHEIIYQRSQNSGGTWNVERDAIDVDEGGNHWGWFKLSPTTALWDRLAVLWCDNALTPYEVHFGQVSIPVVRAVTESSTGADVILALGNVIDEAAAAAETIAGGEDVDLVDEVGVGVETFNQDRDVADAAAAGEVVVLDPVQFDESAEGAETFPGGPDIPVSETPSGVETLVQDNPLTVAESGAGAESLEDPDQVLETVQETGDGVESFPEAARQIIETVRALEVFLEAEPNLVASVYDSTSSHTSNLFRLDTAQWTEVSEQTGLAHKYQKLYQFKDAVGMGAILFRRRGPSNGRLTGPWSALERSEDLGVTWTGVLSNCADVVFGLDGVGFAIATGGDVRAHRIYKSINQGVDWTEVYNDDPEGVLGEEPPYQRIAVDPTDNDRVLVMGNRAGHDRLSQLDLRMLSTVDGFDTAPTVRVNPIGGFWLFTHQRTLVGAADGRWVFTGRPDFTSGARHQILTSDDDGVTWDLRLDQLWTIVNEETHQILYEGGGKLFTVQQSNVNPVWRSIDNGDTWVPVNIKRVESPDDPAVVLNVPGEFPSNSIAYDREADRLFVGTLRTEYPVIAQVAVQSGLVWRNLRANMVDVVGPGNTSAQSLACSNEGLIQVASLGEVRVLMQDTGGASETLDNLRSVLEEVTVVDEIVETEREVLETAAGTDTSIVSIVLAEVVSGGETLTLVLEVTDVAAAAEIFTRVDENWLAVRLLLHEGVARLRLEGPAYPSVPGR